MNEAGYIVVIKFKFLQLEKMFNIFKVTCDQVVHPYHRITFFDKTVAKMRAQETGGSCD